MLVFGGACNAHNLSSAFQQATSGVSKTNQQCYQLGGNCFSIFGFEYKPGKEFGHSPSLYPSNISVSLGYDTSVSELQPSLHAKNSNP